MATMYRMPKLVETPQVTEVPGTMYKMPVLNKMSELDLASTYYDQTRASTQTQNGPDVAALEARQEAVLARLRHLKAQLDKVQGNKITTPSPSISAAPVLGAPAHSSPTRIVSNPKREMVRAVAAMGGHLADLTSLQFDSLVQPRRIESCQREMKKQHDSILHRLVCLRTELDRLSAASKQTNMPPEEPLSLAERQHGILKVISALKGELERLALLQRHPEIEKSPVHDLVISANPRHPPYSLVLLRRLLKQAGSPVLAVNHMHSSVFQINDSLRAHFSDQPLAERRDHPLAFTLHWKDVTASALMVNPLRQTQICGEVNIARYISRLFPLASPFNYEAIGSFPTIAETDQLLDQLSRQLSSSSNNKERQAALRMLNGRLGKNTFLMGCSCGIADVLAWSLVKQLGLDIGASSNVAKWYKNLTSMAGLELESATPESKHPSESNMEKSNLQQVRTEAKKQEASPKSAKVTIRDTAKKSPSVANGDATKKSPAIANGVDIKKPHMDRAGLESYLKSLGIKYQVTDHEEVFTVEALMKCVKEKNIPGLHMKNLFLKDKKRKDLYLLSARHDAEVKLSDVAKQVGVKELRFADESVMLDVIGVAQGCVTPFALANDTEQKVTFLLDSVALDSSHAYVNFHPLSNAATLGVSPQDLRKFLGATGHQPKLLNFA